MARGADWPGAASSAGAGNAGWRWRSEMLGEEGDDGVDGLGDKRLGVVQVDVLVGIQPDDVLRLAHPLVGLPGALGGTVGVLDPMDDQPWCRGQEVSAHHVVDSQQ